MDLDQALAFRATIGEIGQKAHDDLLHRPCGVTQSLVYAGLVALCPNPILQVFGARIQRGAG